MAQVARGTVLDRPWGKTLASVGLRGFSGQLTVTEAGKQYAIGFDQGAVCAAFSPSPADAAARVAMTLGLISSSQVADLARRQAADPRRDEIELIAEVARLSPEQADKLRRRCIAQRATRTFALESGEFVVDNALALPSFPEAAIDIRAVIYLAAKTAISDARLAADLATLGGRFQLREEAREDLPQYGFTANERDVLVAMYENAHSVESLEAASGSVDPRTVRAVVYALATTGAATITAAAKPRAATEHAAAPPPVAASSPPPRPAAAGQSLFGGVAPPAAQPRAAARLTETPPATLRTPAKSTAQPATTLRPPASRPAAPTPAAPAPARPVVAAPPAGPFPDLDAPTMARPARQTAGRLPATAGTGTGAGKKDGGKDAGAAARTIALLRERLKLLDSGANHFALLGISQETPPADVRSAFFELARQLHPDRMVAVGAADAPQLRNDAQRLFAQLNTAFAVLNDATKRHEYVSILRQGGEAAVRAKQAQAEELALRLLEAEEHFRVGEMALRRGQFDVAAQKFARALELNPDEADHVALSAWAQFCIAPDKRTAAKAARTGLERALTIAPRNVTPYVYLGRMERLLGDDNAAIAYFEKVLAKYPDHSEVAAEMRGLAARRKK